MTCHCTACGQAKLNPEPTEYQLTTFARHKRNGTSPGNPKWYRLRAVKRFVFTPGKKPVYARIETGAEWLLKHRDREDTAACPFSAARRYDNPADYVKMFDHVSRFK